jgi:hypothetical protein
MAAVFFSRVFVLSGLLFAAACVSTPEPPAAFAIDVPLPRARPATRQDVSLPRARLVALREAPQEAAPREKSNRDSEKLLREWALCKLLFAEGSARKTSQPVEELLQATFAACAEREDELKLSLARKQVPEAMIAATLTDIRAHDREQLAARIMAVRQSH